MGNKTDMDLPHVSPDILSDEEKEAILRLSGATPILDRNRAVRELAEAKPDEIQKIGASQITILDSYYRAALEQATMSFKAAMIAAVIGLAFFLAAVVLVLTQQPQSLAIVSVIPGALVEAIAGISFWLYVKATAQLADFHERLDRTQRFLLANSICESLHGDSRDQSRADLVRVIATSGPGIVRPAASTSEGE